MGLYLKIFLFPMIQGDEDGQHYGERPERGSSVAHKGQWNAYDRHYPDGHSYIYEQVHKQAARKAISIDPCETLSASLCVTYDPKNQHNV